jgi:hypothetical protein
MATQSKSTKSPHRPLAKPAHNLLQGSFKPFKKALPNTFGAYAAKPYIPTGPVVLAADSLEIGAEAIFVWDATCNVVSTSLRALRLSSGKHFVLRTGEHRGRKGVFVWRAK